MAQQINSKTFELIVKNSKTYQLIVEGFTITSLWFIQFLLSVGISIVISLTTAIQAIFNLTVQIDIGTMLLTSKITTSLSNDISLDALASLTYKISSSIQSTLITDFIVRVRSKVSTAFDMVNSISFTLILALFNALEDFDGETLATMDVQTLGALDYTAT